MRRATGFEVEAPETVYFAAHGTLDSYRKHGVDKYEYLATLDARTSDKCAALDGKVFDVEKAVPGENYPPAHPNCRSTTMAFFPEDEEEPGIRIAKDKDGKAMYVPADMSYQKGYNTYVNEDNIEKPDIHIPASLGAAASQISVSVLDPSGKIRYCILKEGSTITKVKVFAGKGTKQPLRVGQALADQFGGAPEDWQHVRGEGIVVDGADERRAELHWFEREGSDAF